MFNLCVSIVVWYLLQCAKVKEQIQQIERFQSEISKYVVSMIYCIQYFRLLFGVVWLLCQSATGPFIHI